MIRHSQDNGLWIVTIDRPDAANAMSRDMLMRLAEIAEQARTAKAFIITGTGRVFSAGADLEEVRGANLATDPVWERLSGAIADIQGLTIAALNGTIAGGAMGMALACDLRIAVPSAKAFYPVMKIGVLPQPSDPARMTALIGPARTKYILLAGQKIDAQTALAWGLFDQIVDDGDPAAAAKILCADMLTAETAQGHAVKQMIRT